MITHWSFVLEMVSTMKDIVEIGVGLSSEERNLLSAAYKNVIGSKRASWRIVHGLLGKVSHTFFRPLCEFQSILLVCRILGGFLS